MCSTQNISCLFLFKENNVGFFLKMSEKGIFLRKVIWSNLVIQYLEDSCDIVTEVKELYGP